jgi:hypothetical protein
MTTRSALLAVAFALALPVASTTAFAAQQGGAGDRQVPVQTAANPNAANPNANPGASLAANPYTDPYYGQHTMRDIWGHVVIAPGEDTSHGGSTTQSLGVTPPGSSDGGA